MPGVDPYPTPMHGTPAATTDGDRFLKAIRQSVADSGRRGPAGLTLLPPGVEVRPDPRLAVATEVLAALVAHQGTPCGNPGNPGHWQRWAAFAADAAEALAAELDRRAAK